MSFNFWLFALSSSALSSALRFLTSAKAVSTDRGLAGIVSCESMDVKVVPVGVELVLLVPEPVREKSDGPRSIDPVLVVLTRHELTLCDMRLKTTRVITGNLVRVRPVVVSVFGLGATSSLGLMLSTTIGRPILSTH